MLKLSHILLDGTFSMNLYLRKPLAIIALMTPLWICASPDDTQSANPALGNNSHLLSDTTHQELYSDPGLTHLEYLNAVPSLPMTGTNALIQNSVVVPGSDQTPAASLPLPEATNLDASCTGYTCLQSLQPDIELDTLSQRTGLNHDALNLNGNSTRNFKISKLDDPENLPIEFHNSWQSLLSKYPFLILTSASNSSTPQGISYYYGAITAISATLLFILIWRWRWKTTTNHSPQRI